MANLNQCHTGTMGAPRRNFVFVYEEVNKVHADSQDGAKQTQYSVICTAVKHAKLPADTSVTESL